MGGNKTHLSEDRSTYYDFGDSLFSVRPDASKSKSKDTEVYKMGKKVKKRVCVFCGYTSSGRFVGDICPQCSLAYWKCANCGLLITTDTPPEVCPGCQATCEFINVTCYIPECGGPGHIDPRL